VRIRSIRFGTHVRDSRAQIGEDCLVAGVAAWLLEEGLGGVHTRRALHARAASRWRQDEVSQDSFANSGGFIF
jgi:hypothetical protein